MLGKTGLLIVSNPTQIGKTLSSIEKYVKKTLYIQLLSALNDSFGSFHANVLNSWPKHSKTIHGIYCQAARHCQQVDVRVLLSGIKYKVSQIKTTRPIDLVIFDKAHSPSDIENFVRTKIANVAHKYDVVTIDSGAFHTFEGVNNIDEQIHDHTVLGGTFDRLHIAHKLLLSEAALRSSAKVTIGVTEENMIHSKLLWELIENIEQRLANVKDFMLDICPEVDTNVVPISDPFGPAIVDPTMGLIVVSAETIKGGDKINEIRQSKGLNKLHVLPIELVDEPFPQSVEETKISSSNLRLRLLGTLLHPIRPNTNIPTKPYIIGLTGGIASGKSGIAKRLEELGTLVIDCDKIGHSVYKPGKPCHKVLVEHFGQRILSESGEIDRKVLGGIVFKNPDELKKLNSLVWPAIADEVQEVIRHTDKDVVCIEAAILLQAEWEKYCHEVWTTIIPPNEAVNRLKSRNGLTEEQALSRIQSQPPNTSYVKASNVVFCTLWEYEYTKSQVDKAWALLKNRLL